MLLPEAVQNFPDAQALAAFDETIVTGGKFDRGEWTIEVAAAKVVAALDFLRVECAYNLLADLTATDSFPAEPRFQVVYHLYSISKHQFLRVKANLPGDAAEIGTASTIWPAAGWHEREVFDLFGIRFQGHLDLRRIVLPDNWEGYPLRKDYPTEGPR